ncbi:MAG: hypothetical protein GY896_22825 [Gammaproteobacteria bacterium]|nr:hypothetical protein [Gammaproteobacteria bacterium]
MKKEHSFETFLKQQEPGAIPVVAWGDTHTMIAEAYGAWLALRTAKDIGEDFERVMDEFVEGKSS